MSAVELVVSLFILFSWKHFIADFAVQPAYMYLNKGKLFHPGGWLHSLNHIILSWIVLRTMGFTNEVVTPVLIFEFFAHYIIDFGKVNIAERFGWHSKTPEFWYLLGLDQLLHYFTYCYIVWILCV